VNPDAWAGQLARIPPFDRLDPDEVSTLAGVASARRFGPGEVIVAAGQPVGRITIVLEGSAEEDPEKVLGLLPALLGFPQAQNLHASAQGAMCLRIRRGQFYTIVFECPEILAWLLEKQGLTPPTQARP
jgi:signal-transduction protein with cAMP-binding, CBS, and nucleotidyltransferase domain